MFGIFAQIDGDIRWLGSEASESAARMSAATYAITQPDAESIIVVPIVCVIPVQVEPAP